MACTIAAFTRSELAKRVMGSRQTGHVESNRIHPFRHSAQKLC